jgi:hypothetical protein
MLLLLATDFCGIKLVLGRTFRLEEAGGRHRFAIQDYGYWRRHFNFRSNCDHARHDIEGEQYASIGVLPAEFAALFSACVIVPFDTDWEKRLIATLTFSASSSPESRRGKLVKR